MDGLWVRCGKLGKRGKWHINHSNYHTLCGINTEGFNSVYASSRSGKYPVCKHCGNKLVGLLQDADFHSEVE